MVYYVIPARQGSKGIPFKNRKLIHYTLESVKGLTKSNVIITTNDMEILKLVRNVGYSVLYRNTKKVHQDDSNPKDVLLDVVKMKKLKPDDIIVLLYLTYPERTIEDIRGALRFFEQNKCKSLLCKKNIEGTHPYLYMYEEEGGKGRQLVKHNLYRRQDYPKVFEISHFIFVSYVFELPNLKKNLYNKDTIFYPIRNVLDVDTPKELKQLEPPVEIKGSYKEQIKPLDPNIQIRDVDSMREKQFKFMELNEFREYIRKKDIICVANSGMVRDSGEGEYIDSYDIVVRFNSFIIDPENTGEKTNIHATTYLQDYNMDVPCDLRIICCNKKYPYWRHFIKEKVEPGKQEYILRRKWFYDHKIFREYSHINRIIPTTGFSIIRLLYWAGTFNSLHLMGFDFFKNKDPYRQTPGISTAHNYNYEADWVKCTFKPNGHDEVVYRNENLTG